MTGGTGGTRTLKSEIDRQIIATAKSLLLDALNDQEIHKELRAELAKWVIERHFMLTETD